MIHVCNVEEAHATNFAGYLYWHFICPGCNVRCRLRAGEGEVNCGRCKTSYLIRTNGAVFQELPSSVEISRPSPEAHRSPPRGLRGMLSDIASAAVEANESAHGKRLREGLLSTGAHLKNMEEHVLSRTMQGFISKCEALEHELDNWSVEGRIKMGRELQTRARKEFDFNQAESHALWMAGAWLESRSRTSDDAVFLGVTLEQLRRGI